MFNVYLNMFNFNVAALKSHLISSLPIITENNVFVDYML